MVYSQEYFARAVVTMLHLFLKIAQSIHVISHFRFIALYGDQRLVTVGRSGNTAGAFF